MTKEKSPIVHAPLMPSLFNFDSENLRKGSYTSFTTQISPRCNSRTRALVVPAQVCVVAEFSRLNEMGDCEEGAEHDADSANNNVGDA